MDVREKLVGLLSQIQSYGVKQGSHITHQEGKTNREIALHLIAHGVTVQAEAKLYWKPVKPGEWNLTCSACDSHLGCKENASYCPECGAKFVYHKAVMPQPPKGE